MASSPQNDFLILMLVVLGLFGLWAARGGPERSAEGEQPRSLFSVRTFSIRDRDESLSGSNGSGSSDSSSLRTTLTESPWKDKVTITTGSARSTYQPAEEYITIKASSRLKEPVQLTGWMVQNGAGSRLYDQNGKVVTGKTRLVKIPTGVYHYTNSSADTFGPIMLAPGEQAVVTTGVPRRVVADVTIPGSFRTNLCTGYIDRLSNSDFYPTLPQTCPNPDDESGLDVLSLACQDFIERRIARCHTPKFSDYKTISGERERGDYVDGFDGLSSTCRAFIKRHFNYQGCLDFHSTDPDFYKKGQWRIYLGQTWELWSKNNEIISLYDAQGRLVDQVKY
jgi:hypothetical protein